MRNSFIVTLAATTLFATTASAETYICQMSSNGQTAGLISDTIAINIDDVTFDVVVSDAVILATNNRPIAANLATYSRKRLVIKWSIQGVKGTRNRIFGKVHYKLAIWKSRGNKASVIAKYDGLAVGGDLGLEANGSGKCELRR